MTDQAAYRTLHLAEGRIHSGQVISQSQGHTHEQTHTHTHLWLVLSAGLWGTVVDKMFYCMERNCEFFLCDVNYPSRDSTGQQHYSTIWLQVWHVYIHLHSNKLINTCNTIKPTKSLLDFKKHRSHDLIFSADTRCQPQSSVWLVWCQRFALRITNSDKNAFHANKLWKGLMMRVTKSWLEVFGW